MTATFPSVVEVMNRRGRLLGLLVAGLGIVTVVSSTGRRTADARNAVAVSGAALMAASVYIFTAGKAEVAMVYAIFGVVAFLGLVLTRARPAP